jgi:hypothetical protein
MPWRQQIENRTLGLDLGRDERGWIPEASSWISRGVKPEREERTMARPASKMASRAKEIRYRGLCTTCKHNGECALPRDHDCPVVHCEEFDDREDYRLITAPAEAAPATPGAGRVGNRRVPSSVQGLCRTCESYGNCNLSKSTGGVWHCEEYC